MLKRPPLNFVKKGSAYPSSTYGLPLPQTIASNRHRRNSRLSTRIYRSFYLVNSSVPKFDRLGGRSAAASGAATELDVCAIHIEAVTIFAFNFLKFRDAATERTALKHRIRLSWFAHPPYSALPINFAIIKILLA
jgi:hypothetical protein